MRVLYLAVSLLLAAAAARAFESFQRLVPNGDRVRTKDGKLWEGMGQCARHWAGRARRTHPR